MTNKATPKKIIICFDGTGNSAADIIDGEELDNGITNVLKIHLFAGGSIDNSAQEIPGQKSFYYTGIGTRSNDFINRLRFILALRGPWLMIEECRRDLKAHYNKGDQIFIFGFSRGAAVARLFVSEITKHGFDGRQGHVDSKHVSIAFLGLWETVENFMQLNLDGDTLRPCDPLREDGSISSAVERVVHLMCLDDGRITFFPTPIGDVDDDRRREIWFPGTHGDVGGFRHEHGLCDAALQFMMRTCSHDLPEHQRLQFLGACDIKEENRYDAKNDLMLGDECIDINPNFLAPFEDVADPLHPVPFLPERHIPRPVYLVKNDERIPDSVVFVHESIVKRAKHLPEYRPENLRHVKFRIVYDDRTTSDKVYNGLAEALIDETTVFSGFNHLCHFGVDGRSLVLN